MPTQTGISSDRDESRSRRSGGSSTAARRAKAAVNPDTILDIIERLGVVDLVIARLRSRMEDLDTDELLDDVTDYLRRNPEVLVVALGTITIAAGIIVYLSRREAGHDHRGSRRTSYGDEVDESESTRRTAAAAARKRV